MLEDGLSFPLQGDTALGRLLIGGLLGIFSILIIPGFALIGYLLRVLAYSARGEDEPPPFEDWGGLIVEGLKGTFVLILYGLVPVLILMVVVGVSSTVGTPGGIVDSLSVVGILATMIAVAILYYAAPAGLTNMALEGRMAAAFEFSTLKKPLLSLEYFIAWLLPFVIAVLINIASIIVVTFTLGLGLVLIPFIQFYFQVSIFYMFGRAFGSVVEVNRSQRESVPYSV